MNKKLYLALAITLLLIYATLWYGGCCEKYYLGGGYPMPNPVGIPYTETIHACYGYEYVIVSPILDAGADGICFGYLHTTQVTKIN